MLNISLKHPSVRMKIGKIGIWLAIVGRYLQVHYANWNSEFRLHAQVYPDNPNARSFHVSERVTSDSQLSFDSPKAQPTKMTPLFRELFEMRYLWQRPHRLDDSSLRALIGPPPATPLVQALRQSLIDLGLSENQPSAAFLSAKATS